MGKFSDCCNRILNYKLEKACFCVPLRGSVLFVGYFYVLLSIITILSIESSYYEVQPPVHLAVVMVVGDESEGILVCMADMAASVVLLCAAHRKDVALLRFYLYCGVTFFVISGLVYSLVIAMNFVGVINTMIMVVSVLYQAYTILLVRSLISEIKLEEALNGGTALSETLTNNILTAAVGTTDDRTDTDQEKNNYNKYHHSSSIMPALVFDTCCGCIELRTGSLVIGYLNLIGEVILIILGIVILAGSSTVVTVASGNSNLDHMMMMAGGNSNLDHNMVMAGGNSNVEKLATVVVAFSAIILIILFLFLGFTITLLVGIHKDKRGHVKAYLIYGVIFMVVYFIAFLGSFAGPNTTGEIVKKVIALVVCGYFLLVIRSYYYKMEDKPAVRNTA